MMACGRCAEACAVTMHAEATTRQGQRSFYVCQRVLTQQWQHGFDCWVTLTAVTVPAKRHTAISWL
jgi:hypothetical protein